MIMITFTGVPNGVNFTNRGHIFDNHYKILDFSSSK